MVYSMRSMGMTFLGLTVGWVESQAAVIVANHDNPGGLAAGIAAEPAALPEASTANYAFVQLPPIGHPLQITDDGTAVLITYNAGNVCAYRWRRGVMTELSCVRPTGTRIKLHAANRNGMVVVVFELPTRDYFAFEGGATKQVVVAWMPDSTTPIFLNVPIAEATTWGVASTMRSIDFKFLDDQNRIWGDTYHVVQGPNGTLIYPELARWDTPNAAATFIGHKQYLSPSVILLGVSSGSGEPFGRYFSSEGAVYHFAGSFSNRLDYVPSSMNSQGWVIGKRGFTSVLSKDGKEYPLPANTSITHIDDKNNLHDTSGRVWTTDPLTVVSTPTIGQSSYIPLAIGRVILSEGYSTNQGMIPGDESLRLGYLFQGGNATPAIFVPAELRPDANRDGIITTSRFSKDPDLLLAEKSLPWYFWVNDDNDSGETDGNDIPGEGSNGRDTSVNGVRDLVDFFPLHLNIARLMALLPPTTPGIRYQLTQADAAANFLTTDLTPATAGEYHLPNDSTKALGTASVTPITNDGAILNQPFLDSIATQGKGVILVEARKPTTNPLRLEVRRGAELLASLDLPIRFSGVEDMFRHRNLVKAVGEKADTHDRNNTPNWPDSLNNNQAFIFLHGYNVNQKQARGWQAEFFKRLWWSGSKAQFWGVTWYGSESQISIGSKHMTPNYHANVIQAFGTAYQFSNFITDLRVKEGIAKINVAAHSLGNMVTSSAISDHDAPVDRYFLIDAAVAAEAYDAANNSSVVQPDDATAFLPHTQWNKELDGVYDSRLWPTNWHKLFASLPDDRRAHLTWRNRFLPRTGTEYYDFYSTGEEVLGYDDAHSENTPSLGGVLANEIGKFLHITLPEKKNQPVGFQTWIYQEQLKGRTVTGKILGSHFGGWGFNVRLFKNQPSGPGKGPVLIPSVLLPNEALWMVSPDFTEDALRKRPFFRPGSGWTEVTSWTKNSGQWHRVTGQLRALYDPSTGSAFASTHRDTLLARMIPAMSLPTGRIPVPRFGDLNRNNFDMNGSTIRPIKEGASNPLWPESRPTSDWWHSDLRDVAYPYVKGLYNEIVMSGGLKDTTL